MVVLIECAVIISAYFSFPLESHLQTSTRGYAWCTAGVLARVHAPRSSLNSVFRISAAASQRLLDR